jgi:hypothetical protein
MNPDTAALSHCAGQWLEAADVRRAESPFESAPLALDVLPLEESVYPGQFGLGELVPVGKQTMQFERDSALLEFVAQDRTR